MRRIVFLVVDIHLNGGGERVVSNMSKYFAERLEYDTEIISMSSNKGSPIFPLHSTTELTYLNIDQDKTHSLKKISRLFKVLIRTKVKLKNYNDNTIILGIGTYASVMLSLSLNKSVTKIGCEHNAYSGIGTFWNALRRLTYKYLDATTSLTEQDYIPLSKISKTCMVIPNARTFDSIPAAKNLALKQILAVGRLSEGKGYDLMLEVMSEVVKHNKNWKLNIVGDGPLKSQIIRDIEDRHLSDYINVLSSTPEIHNHYNNSSIYLMTSRTEGLPMVLLEAQAFGLPIVSFDCDTGPRDIVTNDKDGYLIRPFDTKELSKKLLKLIEDPSLREDFSKNAILSSNRFSEDNIYCKWLALFDKITKNDT